MKRRLSEIYMRHNLLFRLIITLSLAISLPMLIGGLTMVGEAHKKVIQQNTETQMVNVVHFMDYYLSQRSEMIENAVKIGYERRILPKKIASDPYASIEAIQEMQIYTRTVPMAQAGYLYFCNTDYVIGSVAKYRKNIFVNMLAGNSAAMKAKITAMLDQPAEDLTVIASNFDSRPLREASMLVGVPISIESSAKNAVVIYRLNYDSLNASLLGQIESQYYGLYVFSDEGKLLLANKETLSDAIQGGALSPYLKDHTVTSFELEEDGQVYSIFKQFDEKTGMSFLLVGLKEEIDRSVESFYRVFRVTIIIVCIALLALFVAVVYINYLPILNVARRARESFRAGMEAPEKGEIETISLALDQQSSENEAMMEQIAEQQLLLTDYTLKTLLDGKAAAEGEMNRIGLPLVGKRFCVIALADVTLDNVNRMELADKVAKSSSTDVSIIQTMYENYLIFLCTLSDGSHDARGQLAQAIETQLGEMGMQAGKLGVGRAKEKPENIRDSYLEALTSLEQENTTGIVFYEDTINSFSSFENYPSENVLRFLQYVRHGEKDSALAEFDGIVKFISQNVTSYIIRQYICYDVINVLIKSIIKLGIPLSEQDMRNVLMFQNLADLQSSMEELINRVCGEVQYRKMTSGKRLKENIVKYIDENFRNPNLNLPMVADHFEMSIYTLSGVFNEYTGMGFREYVVNRRIEESKRLLLSTNQNVKEIAFAVGFHDVSYFIKLFRKATGVTPNKFKQ